MISVTSNGNYSKTRSFLDRLLHHKEFSNLEKYGQMGVELLSRATPVESGLTASSWTYKVFLNDGKPRIEWHNHNIDSQGVPIVFLLQYGHGTGTGGYVPGHDFINPAMRSLFDKIADDVWREVIK